MLRPAGRYVIIRKEIERGTFVDKAFFRIVSVSNANIGEVPIGARVEVEGNLNPLEYAGEQFFVCKLDKVIGYYYDEN